MCGRYALDGSEEQRRPMRAALLWMRAAYAEDSQRYWGFDCRPTTRRAVFFRAGDNIAMSGARWGWQREFLGKRPLINARYESAADKAMFRTALAGRRCVVPATCYFEWKRDEKDRPLEKFAFRASDGELLLIAGLWEDVVTDGQAERRFLVLTREMRRFAEIHDRTPVLLTPDAAERWLDPVASAAAVADAALSKTDDDLVPRRVINGPSRAVPEGGHLLKPSEPWPWEA
jgi:putative SOS response-associated peptidase YedK